MKRQKRRYLRLQIDSKGELSQSEFLDAAWRSIAQLFGEVGASSANLSMVSYDASKKRATVRVSLGALQCVRASLALITRIGGKDAAVHVIQVSGTIKSLGEKAA